MEVEEEERGPREVASDKEDTQRKEEVIPTILIPRK